MFLLPTKTRSSGGDSRGIYCPAVVWSGTWGSGELCNYSLPGRLYSRSVTTATTTLDLVHVVDLLALLDVFVPWDLLVLYALVDIGRLIADWALN